MTRITRRGLLAALISTLTLSLAAPASADLEKIRATGTISFAVYDDNRPWSGKKEGIDNDLAKAIASKLGLNSSLIVFPAGENVDDDLRNMVWKGHYLGFGPADVMLHVPVDANLMRKNDKVEIFAPYYREAVKLVRNVKAIPELNGVASLEGKKMGAEKVSISAMVLLGEASLRDHVTIYASGVEAVQKLKAGDVDAVVATRAEIESVILGDPAFEVTDAPFTRLPRNGWVLGMSVKKENVELAHAVQKAVNELFDSGEMAALFQKHGVRSIKP
jgi:ABC-type amino acid transport substrate-binding protein